MSISAQPTAVVHALRAELLSAEAILNTQYSFGLAEPSYIKCLELIAGAPEQRDQLGKLITSMLASGEVSDEPVAFLMHVLRWPEVLDWARNQLRHLKNPIANGRPIEKIIAAFSDDWENREFYKMFDGTAP